jgi:hypothetical protein
MSVRAYQNATGTTLGAISGSRPNYTEYTDKNSFYKNVDLTKEFPGVGKCGYGKDKFYIMVQNVGKTPKNIIHLYKNYRDIGVDEW